MNALPAISSPEFISPLAPKLVRFLAQKHAMGYRYREEGRALGVLDRFLYTRLSPEDPVITLLLCTITSLEGALNRRRPARIA
jgi:hypothetical protein